MFFPLPTERDKRVYIAFNEHAPHRYLADSCTSEFRASGKFPTYVIGRIVNIHTSNATQATNPYGLPVGTQYFIVTVSAVEWG